MVFTFATALQRPSRYYQPITLGTPFFVQRNKKRHSGQETPWDTEDSSSPLAGGTLRPPQFYEDLRGAELQALRRIYGQSLSEAELEELLWANEDFLPWWKRRRYIREQQRAPLVKHEIHLPKPAALPSNQTTARRALVQPKTGPTPKGDAGTKGTGAGAAALLKALGAAAAAIFFRIVEPQPRYINGTLYSKAKRKPWEEQENYG